MNLILLLGNNRGIIISAAGLGLILVSILVAITFLPSNLAELDNLSESLYEGLFDEISSETDIASGSSAYFTHDVSSNTPLLWSIQIADYQLGDTISTSISNIFGDDYGTFIQDEPISFEVLEIKQSDTLTFEVTNTGSASVIVIAMFSADPENSDILTNPDSQLVGLVVPLAISGILLVLGVIISIIGAIVILVDLKNKQKDKRNY